MPPRPTSAAPRPTSDQQASINLLQKEVATLKHLLKDSQTSAQYLKKESLRLEHERNILAVEKDEREAELNAQLDSVKQEAERER